MQKQPIKKQALLALLISISLTQTSFAQTKTIEHPSHPLSSEELFQRITTLIELPLPQINKKNVEKNMGIKLQRLMPKQQYWFFYAQENWGLTYDAKTARSKLNLNFRINLSNIKKTIASYEFLEGDLVPPCISPETIEIYLNQNHWGKEGVVFRATDGGRVFPPDYDQQPFIKDSKYLEYGVTEITVLDKKMRCINDVILRGK